MSLMVLLYFRFIFHIRSIYRYMPSAKSLWIMQKKSLGVWPMQHFSICTHKHIGDLYGENSTTMFRYFVDFGDGFLGVWVKSSLGGRLWTFEWKA